MTALGLTLTSRVSKISLVHRSMIRSLTVRVRAWLSSWCTMATPFSSASLELLKLTSFPSSKIVPLSLLYMPNRHFIRVDLPAPFSPIRA